MNNNLFKIHIITVFSPSTMNTLWLKLQRQFLEETTKIPYRYSVYLNGCDDKLFSNIEVIGQQEYVCKSNEFSHDHVQCLQKLIPKIDHSCEYFLLLDSDCFPVTTNWHDILAKKMCEFGFNQAAPIRTENLDIFPHPSAMFFNKNGIHNFNPMILDTINLLGKTHRDNSCPASFFPLLRTNKVNVHPICAAIYYDMFYHHGAGSREVLFRSTDIDKYYEYPNHRSWAAEATRQLIADPHNFINRLKR